MTIQHTPRAAQKHSRSLAYKHHMRSVIHALGIQGKGLAYDLQVDGSTVSRYLDDEHPDCTIPVHRLILWHIGRVVAAVEGGVQ